MKLNRRERATVLAALRHWQQWMLIYGDEVMTAGCGYAGHFADHKPLTPIEIDGLCDRVNTITGVKT